MPSHLITPAQRQPAMPKSISISKLLRPPQKSPPPTDRLIIPYSQASRHLASNCTILFTSRQQLSLEVLSCPLPKLSTPHSPSISSPLHHHLLSHILKTKPKQNSPLSPLLIKHPMPTLLTPNRIAPLKRYLAIAVTTQVIDRWAVDAGAAAEGVAGWLRGCDGGLIGFAGHFCGVLCWFLVFGEAWFWERG